MALQAYARQAQNVEMERQACEIRLRAERRVGQLLKGMDKAQGAREPGTDRGATRCPEVTASAQRTLADVGVTKKQSSQWQKLADVDSETFEQAVKQDRPTTSGIIEQAAPPREPKKNAVGAPPCGFGAGCSTRRLHWRLTLASAKTWKSMFG